MGLLELLLSNFGNYEIRGNAYISVVKQQDSDCIQRMTATMNSYPVNQLERNTTDKVYV